MIERIEKMATRTRAGIAEMANENAASAGFARLGTRKEPNTTRNRMLTTALSTEVQSLPLRPREPETKKRAMNTRMLAPIGSASIDARKATVVGRARRAQPKPRQPTA